MKSFTRICLLLSAVFIALGIAGIATGMAMGIRPSQLGDLAHVPGSYAEKLDIIPRNETTASGIYEFENVRSLDLDFSVCDLQILSHDQNKVILEAENPGDTFHCSLNGGKLTVEDQRDSAEGFNPRTNHQELRLTLYLPIQKLERIDISNEVGNVEAESLYAEDISLECSVGDIQITVPGKSSDYNYELECDIGEIAINHHSQNSSHHSEKHDALGNELSVDNQAVNDVELSCSIGNITLNFKEE